MRDMNISMPIQLAGHTAIDAHSMTRDEHTTPLLYRVPEPAEECDHEPMPAEYLFRNMRSPKEPWTMRPLTCDVCYYISTCCGYGTSEN